MKKIELYACEVCGTQYKEKLKCQQCEKSHKKPVVIVKEMYEPVEKGRNNYPSRLHVKMSDENVIVYVRVH